MTESHGMLGTSICSCGWRGPDSEAVRKQIDTRNVRLLCPKCGKSLGVEVAPDPETGSPFGRLLS